MIKFCGLIGSGAVTVTSPDAKMMLITGGTYPVKDRLKALGARWDGDARGWRIPENMSDEARRIVRGEAAEQQTMDFPGENPGAVHDQTAWAEAKKRARDLELLSERLIADLQRARAVITELERDLRGKRDVIAGLERQLQIKNQPTSQAPIQMTNGDVITRIVKQWYSAMSRIFHPDMGGSAEKQAVLNQCYSDLKQRLESTCQASQNGKSKMGAPW